MKKKFYESFKSKLVRYTSWFNEEPGRGSNQLLQLLSLFSNALASIGSISKFFLHFWHCRLAKQTIKGEVDVYCR